MDVDKTFVPMNCYMSLKLKKNHCFQYNHSRYTGEISLSITKNVPDVIKSFPLNELGIDESTKESLCIY